MAGAGGGGMLVTFVTLVTLGGDGSLAASGGGVTGCFGSVSVVSSTTGNTKPLEEMRGRRLALFDSDFDSDSTSMFCVVFALLKLICELLNCLAASRWSCSSLVAHDVYVWLKTVLGSSSNKSAVWLAKN